MPYYVCALPEQEGHRRSVGVHLRRSPAEIEPWARQHDQRKGALDCPNPRKPGATRPSKETIAEIRNNLIDVDPKDISETMAEVDARLREPLLPPSEIRDSGRGHSGVFGSRGPSAQTTWRWSPAWTRCANTCHLCGDRQVMHQAALFRRPGTHNTKGGGWLNAVLVSGRSTDGRDDLTELEKWSRSTTARYSPAGRRRTARRQRRLYRLRAA